MNFNILSFIYQMELVAVYIIKYYNNYEQLKGQNTYEN